MDYISEMFSKDIQEHFFHSVRNQLSEKKHKIALVSTPRVGSTMFSNKLSPIAGKSIYREWLHDKYCIAFQQLTGKDFDPFVYLEQVLNLFNPKTNTFILNVHIHQYEYWKTNYQIDVFEYFQFDRVYYIRRDNFFDQVFSFAIAMKSGLWGSEIEEALKIGKDYKVLVSEEDIVTAITFLKKQQENYKILVEKHTDYIFSAERIMENQGTDEVSYLIKDVGIDIPDNIILKTQRHQPQKQRSVSCPKNKFEMKKYFTKYMLQHSA
ncbi:hypothetical protein [Aliiglaciecola litoralis]|uniref:Sulphotransferase Stf0 domain-containing protein n=1 Tax=Aliiglaciecola litoralis TaxID=582857 RepID=A0ABP3WYY7_9ALTE